MTRDSRIYVAGHRGLLGSAIIRNLKAKGYNRLIFRTHKELDLTDQAKVKAFFKEEKPEYVFLAAARTGGIGANNAYPADFLMENQLIQCNILRASHDSHVKKLIFLGSSCIYPRDCTQPIKESCLLTGPLEPTNEAFALAKISGIKMCQYYNRQYGAKYISVIPNNLYGPHDSYDIEKSHVLPALIRKMHEAKLESRSPVEIWGSGAPLREFLHSDDAADACVFLMENDDGDDFFNVGTGQEISIKDLALLIKKIADYSGQLVFNTGRPDGMPKKLLDISKIRKLGWTHKIELEDGIKATYELYKSERI